MPRYIAFLRAVNVGGRIVKMDALRAHFEAAGFTGVETFIASGNVIFSSDATEQELAETTLIAAALRAGGAMTHGTHTLE